MKRAFILSIALLLCACAAPAGEDQEPLDPNSPFVRGTARVVSVNQSLGQIILEFEGRQVEAFWQTESSRAQLRGEFVQNNPAAGPVGHYYEAQVNSHAFDVRPGDIIHFIGFRTGQSIFLRSAVVQ
jgi:hypothetical protein